MSQNIGAAVRERREARGETRMGLAYHSGLSLAAVALIEDGRRPDPRASTVAKLSKALGISADELLSHVQ